MPHGRIVILGWADSTHIQRWSTGLRDRGYEVSVVSVGGQVIPGIPTIIYPRGAKGTYLKYLLRARRDVIALQPDIVHCHYASGFGLWAQFIAHKPTIVSVWGSDVIGVGGIEKWLVRRTLSRADWVTATGRFLQHATLGVLPDIGNKLTVIPFGITPPTELTPLPSGPVKICYLKEHRAIYGPDILVEAFAKARAEIPDLRLSLAGSGPMEGALRARLQELQLLDDVEFPGYLTRLQVVDYLSNHHILVMPSRMESFGVAALEASACGRPVIASNVGGIPEVVVDGTTGLLVTPGDVDALAEAIVRLAADRVLMIRLGTAGREFVAENYEWEKCLDKMSELYDRVRKNVKADSIS
jgi:glycosyltransferase involved in cell wall biosynthesis